VVLRLSLAPVASPALYVALVSIDRGCLIGSSSPIYGFPAWLGFVRLAGVAPARCHVERDALDRTLFLVFRYEVRTSSQDFSSMSMAGGA
jgi:hypothetical protein